MSGIEQMTFRRSGVIGEMVTFTFYIRDDRYDVPAMDFVIVQDEERARMLADRRLQASAHHTAVEVYEGEVLRFSVAAGPVAYALH
jgi:hypothetical protein